MKTYSKKFNAQRAARVELGDDAIEGIDFRTVKTDAGWTWEQAKAVKPKPPIVAAIDAAIERGLSPKQFVAAAEKVADVLATAGRGKRAAVEDAARNGKLPEAGFQRRNAQAIPQQARASCRSGECRRC